MSELSAPVVGAVVRDRTHAPLGGHLRGTSPTPGSVQVALPSPKAACASCIAVCCRLTVVLDALDDIPAHLTARTDSGLRVMAKDRWGWCAALERPGMRCGIYEQRPQTCRRFVMNGPYCRAVRAEHAYAAGVADLA